MDNNNQNITPINTPSTSSVALVNMPIAATQSPSLGLSILKSELTDIKIDSDIHYLNMNYAELVGLEILEDLELIPTAQLVGDWIFAEALWGKDKQRDEDYIEQILRDSSLEHKYHDNRKRTEPQIEDIRYCRNAVAGFMRDCVEKIDWSKYQVVGFTSLFQQHVAALALAKQIKQLHPEVLIVFGGANCNNDMGKALIDNFSFVDVVCTGMGESVFPQLVQDVLSGKAPSQSKDLLVRASIASLPNPRTTSKTMDELLFPDFDDFFEQREMAALPTEKLSMMVETSRGCWWGQKQHCTFCGLNADSMNFKFKSSERAMAEFKHLVERYGHHTKTIAVVDNIIPMDYLKGFLIELRDSDLELDIFYETKANLKKEHIQLYKDAGLTSIQPGVESFNNRLLKNMRKGITGLQNIQFLKWCREFGLRPIWNYMVGFPGEEKADHEQQLELMKSMSHFYPPDVAWVRIDRYSPFHTSPEEHGLSNVRPFGSFKYLYPGLDEEQRERIAYYFLADFDAQKNMDDYAFDVRDAIGKWNDDFANSALFHLELNGRLVIADYRPNVSQNVHRLSDQQRLVYEACDQIRGESFLFDLLSLEGSKEEQRSELNSLLESLIEHNVMLRDGTKYLSLSVSINNGFFPPEIVWAKMNELFLESPEINPSPKLELVD
jgi:ribosomal peptide maturation radical SAM protein 1